jgi:hypothetical protein
MVQAGFAELNAKLDLAITREEFNRWAMDLRQDVADLQQGFVNVRNDLASVNDSIDGIADELLDNHRIRIAKLEDQLGHD